MTGFEPTPLIHCSTIRLALRPAPSTTSTPYIYWCMVSLTNLAYMKDDNSLEDDCSFVQIKYKFGSVGGEIYYTSDQKKKKKDRK
jgi:hypothetical protein